MAEDTLAKRVEKLTALLEVGKVLATVRDLDALLPMVLRLATQILEAERSSVFLIDRSRGELWSKVALGLEVREIRLPLGEGIAGTVAVTGEVINIPDAYADPRFNRAVDQRTGYRTRSILCGPMRNKAGDIIGVLQLLNKKEGAFTADDEELLLSLGGQAAVAVENAQLYEEIQRLFEGFIKAAAYAIEARDPTTSGHSERVAVLTVGLAEALPRSSGPYKDIVLSSQDIRELRYASLLHDFGKVGVRENVLVKANKLYEPELELIRARFKFVKRTLEAQYGDRKLRLILRGASGDPERALTALDAELQRELQTLDEDLQAILEANKPTVLPAAVSSRLREIAARTYMDADGTIKNLLSPGEVADLSIGKGSLNPDERREIESHVTHSFQFLQQIPWTRDLSRIPSIAAAHHEKLDGSGYPSRLTAEAIPVQARMMTVSDIYDALTAQDRPYKRALPYEKALDILNMEAKGKQIDPELVRIFVESKTFELVLPKGS